MHTISVSLLAACIDAYGKANCGQWRSNGQCEKNPVWMAANCRQSCQQCDGDPVEATSPLTQSDSHKGTTSTGGLKMYYALE